MFANIAFESEPQSSYVFTTNELGAVRLIRTACKGFHPHGSDKESVADYFVTYLHYQDKRLDVIYWKPSNVQSNNGRAVYHHPPDIKSGLAKTTF